MQEQDIIEKTYWSENRRFADVMNVGMFQGKTVLKSEMLVDENESARAIIKKSHNISTIHKYRDVFKKADFGGEFVLFGIENQTDIHYTMPVKIMGYDYLDYDKQLRKIHKKHRKKKDLQGAELLQWNCIPREVKQMVVDYPIRVLSNFSELKEVKEIYKNEEGEVNMCEAFEQWKKEWKAEGIETGIEALVQDYLGFAKERIIEKIERRFSVSQEKAEEYFERFSKVPCKM